MSLRLWKENAKLSYWYPVRFILDAAGKNALVIHREIMFYVKSSKLECTVEVRILSFEGETTPLQTLCIIRHNSHVTHTIKQSNQHNAGIRC